MSYCYKSLHFYSLLTSRCNIVGLLSLLFPIGNSITPRNRLYRTLVRYLGSPPSSRSWWALPDVKPPCKTRRPRLTGRFSFLLRLCERVHISSPIELTGPSITGRFFFELRGTLTGAGFGSRLMGMCKGEGYAKGYYCLGGNNHRDFFACCLRTTFEKHPE